MNGHHHCMFNEDSLITRIKLAGLANVSLGEFDPEIDLIERGFESIYGIAKKLG